ncbi:hypothetical protein [Hydrogenophaga electricum]|uniref:Ribbon-helix-helix protein CopG domain-containing protein n=1 Tax=Hydrogenophaga electricum TaxID=1230953 RepID=A0ABQ6C0P4_9BURK|nr:hypothetical protein [Hydrogenophaga electricum]GLS13425.1 hypothetical protein GCM10007935_08540 [Hydrogenophaga electricum]
MESHSRERISIDLQGLKGLLLDRSQALGMSPSTLVRTALVQALGVPADPESEVSGNPQHKQVSAKTRLCLRMTREDIQTILAAAKQAGLSPGSYVAELVAGAPWLVSGASKAEQLAALTGSNAHLADLSRNIHALTRLLTLSNVPKALVYRDMLDTLDGDVRRHLAQAAALLADLRPRGTSALTSRHLSR